MSIWSMFSKQDVYRSPFLANPGCFKKRLATQIRTNPCQIRINPTGYLENRQYHYFVAYSIAISEDFLDVVQIVTLTPSVLSVLSEIHGLVSSVQSKPSDFPSILILACLLLNRQSVRLRQLLKTVQIGKGGERIWS
jgi:hypothetical protein